MDEPGFERERLRLARELVGLSQNQLAGLVSLSAAAISQFESGATRPSPESLTQLANALQVPVHFFSQPIVETHEGFFRSLRRTAVADRRRARSVAHIAHDVAFTAAQLGKFPPRDIPQLVPSCLNADRAEIEAIAEGVRQSWSLPDGPVGNVVELLERHGVVVVRLPLGSADVDAFSLPFADHPVVVLGSDKNDRARSRFDTAHELAHLAMHGELIWGVKEVETQAHQFAAAFLMPAQQIRKELPTTVDWPTLFALKEHWQVSLAALLMRAKTLGCMSEGTYLTAVKASSAKGWRRREPVPLGPPEQPQLLLEFMKEASGPLRKFLPEAVIDSITIASTVA
jgi:Zn-dependent peptidase ImmA (M78 family)/transcriptional regulator with XRE-family HTH domain